MASPNLPVLPVLPSTGGRPLTYPQLLDKLKCVCTAGAQITPSSLPSATVDLGDIIAGISKYLSIFSAGYSIIAVVMKMIACIIDVLCALTNPFTTIYAVVRLFGTCLPDFILIFPQFAIPSKIICILKIVLAVIEYILTVIVPLIQDIIENIENLIAAIEDQNQQGISVIAFKIATLVKELYSVLGILAVLEAVYIMIEALLKAGIAIPCGGSGGSCSGCGDDQCNVTLRETSITGTDGIVSLRFLGSNDYTIKFSSVLNKSAFLNLRGFFPKGLDYSSIEDEEEIPYLLTFDDTTYALTGVNSYGSATISHIPQPYAEDGYLSNIYNTEVLGIPVSIPYASGLDIRFGVDTETFLSSYAGSRYVQIVEAASESAALINNGTWLIQEVYDGYNVRLRNTSSWIYPGGQNPDTHLDWKVLPTVPNTTGYKIFTLDINHTELLRHNLIGTGCHPAVRAAAEGFANRFPDASSLELPDLPEFPNLSACLAAMAPEDVTTDYVLANYESIATGAAALADCITSPLADFGDGLTGYVEDIYSRIFSPENSELSADPLVQIVGRDVNITLIPYDINGAKLAQTLPTGIIEATISSDGGTISSTQEVFDESGISTGDFVATLTSNIPVTVKVSADIAGVYVSDFNGLNLVKREIEVQFIPAKVVRIEGDTPEPLGVGSSE